MIGEFLRRHSWAARPTVALRFNPSLGQAHQVFQHSAAYSFSNFRASGYWCVEATTGDLHPNDFDLTNPHNVGMLQGPETFDPATDDQSYEFMAFRGVASPAESAEWIGKEHAPSWHPSRESYKSKGLIHVRKIRGGKSLGWGEGRGVESIAHFWGGTTLEGAGSVDPLLLRRGGQAPVVFAFQGPRSDDAPLPPMFMVIVPAGRLLWTGEPILSVTSGGVRLEVRRCEYKDAVEFHLLTGDAMLGEWDWLPRGAKELADPMLWQLSMPAG